MIQKEPEDGLKERKDINKQQAAKTFLADPLYVG